MNLKRSSYLGGKAREGLSFPIPGLHPFTNRWFFVVRDYDNRFPTPALPAGNDGFKFSVIPRAEGPSGIFSLTPIHKSLVFLSSGVGLQIL